MSADEFWDCDPRTYKAYREKERLEREKENQYLWLQGMYTYQAILLTAPRLNSIKPKKPDKYPDKPFDLNIPTEEEIKVRNETPKELKNNKGYASMLAWMAQVNRHKEQEQNGNNS